MDGDLVAVKPGREARDGQVVVARIEHPETGESEATVKRLYREASGFRLEPANPSPTSRSGFPASPSKGSWWECSGSAPEACRATRR